MAYQMPNQSVGGFIAKLFLKSEFADIHFVFKTDDRTVKVPAHKNILAVGSKVFAAMFFGQLKENEVVDIVDADASEFKEFLQLFYLSQVKLTMKNLKTVVRLADKYDILDRFDTCAAAFEHENSVDNILCGYQLAILLNDQALKKTCENKIQFLIEYVFKSNMFLQCDRDIFENILKIDSPNRKEAELFDACVAWAKSFCKKNCLDENDPENLREELGDCFFLIRFGAMSYEEIGAIMSNKVHEAFFSKKELADLWRAKTDGKWTLEKVEQDPRSTPKFEYTPDLFWRRISLVDHNSSGCLRIIEERESTWFSTNSETWLGDEITFNSLNGISFEPCLEFTVTIYESVKSLSSYRAKKVLFEAKVKYAPSTNTRSWIPESINLDQPILIRPKKMYEIRLQTASNISAIWDTANNKIGDKIVDAVKIKFHRNPFDYPPRRGLVKSLCFSVYSPCDQ